MSHAIAPGHRIRPVTLEPVLGGPVRLPASDARVHLQFRRFAGCPVCNLHLRSFARRHDEIAAAGVREIAVFHSPGDALKPHVHDLPFAVVPDPEKRLYAEYGLESSPRGVLDPRAWLGILRALAYAIWALLRNERPAPALSPHGGRFGLPADFLIASDGTVLASHYGEHVDDHWSVDELLALASRAGAAERRDLPNPERAMGLDVGRRDGG